MTTEPNSQPQNRFMGPGIALMSYFSGPIKFWCLQVPLLAAMGIVVALHLTGLVNSYQFTTQRTVATGLLEPMGNAISFLQMHRGQSSIIQSGDASWNTARDQTRQSLKTVVEKLDMQI